LRILPQGFVVIGRRMAITYVIFTE